MNCPVINARREIKGSHWYKAENVINGGATGIDCEMTYGEMCFYMSTRRMDVARFQLKKPSLGPCVVYLTRLVYAGKSYKWLYNHIIAQMPFTILYRAFTRTYDILIHFGEYMSDLVVARAHKGSPINVSLPDLTLGPATDMAVIMHPGALHDSIKAFLKYLGAFNVKSLVGTGGITIPKHLATPPQEINMETTIPEAFDMETLTAEIALEKINALLKHELTVAEYIYAIEVYHVAAIETMNAIQQACANYIKNTK